jgi:hypothetical protein
MTLATLGYVGYGVEGASTEGTFVTPTVYLPVTSFSFDDSNDYIVPEQIRSSRDRSIALAGPYSTSGSIDMELVPNGIGALIKSALAAKGANTVTTQGAYGTSAYPYTHVFTPGNTSPTFTFEGSAGNLLVRRYGGIRVGSMEIASSFGEIVTSSFSLEGTTRTTINSPYATASFAEVTPFHFTGAKVQRKIGNGAYSDVANVKSFTFGINNNIERIGTLGRTRAYRRTVLGMRDVSLSMTLDFDSAADYNLFLDETEFGVKLDLQGELITGTAVYNSLVITIPRVRYNMTSVPISGGNYIEQSVDCQILRPLDNTDILTLTLVNGESTVPGN